MTSNTPRAERSGGPAWVGRFRGPLRAFLRTETAGARVVLVAAVAALVWANVDMSSYESLWGTSFSVQLGDWRVSYDLRTWVS